MFGKNEIAKARTSAQGFLVHSIFYTIQGEGPWAGEPTIFVRFAGCNLRCHFCDTDFQGGTEYTAEALAAVLMAKADEHDCAAFVLTGGEPFLQPLPDLLAMMAPRDYEFQAETAGTVWPEGLEEYANWNLAIVCSPKTPSVHNMIAHHSDAWKYIIRADELDDDDMLPILSTQIQGQRSVIYRPDGEINEGRIFVQPCDEGDPIKNAANTAAAVKACLEQGYRLSIQMHKIVGVD